MQDKFTETELYNIAVDTYRTKHKLSYKLLCIALRKLFSILPEDCGLYLLMQEISVLHTITKN